MSEVQTEQTQTESTETQQTQTETQTEQQTQQTDNSWVPKRIGEITAARRAAEKRAEEAEAREREKDAELARLRAAAPAPAEGTPTAKPANTGMSQEDFDRLVNARADSLAAQRTQTESMNSKIAAINEAGTKEFGAEFEKAVQNIQMAGIGGPEFLRVLTNVDNPAKVVAYLGKPENLNEALRVGSLDPVQMGIELTKMSEKAVKAFAKQISKAPTPPEPISGRSAESDGVEPDPSDKAAWIAWRQKNARKRR
jgi:hypothetical protein